MEETFCITESAAARPARAEAMVGLLRQRWELESRNAVLEAELREQRAAATGLRERLARMEYESRELIKSLGRVLDDCDDTLAIEGVMLRAADTDSLCVRQEHKWRRRVERIRARVLDRLQAHGISVRVPSGKPSPELDTIHVRIETGDAPAGEIVKVLRSGLIWRGSALRCALVVVAAPVGALEGDLGAERIPPATGVAGA